MLAKLIGFLRYLLGKRDEIVRLGKGDVLLAKAVLDIHRKRDGSEFVFVKLHSVVPIHPIDRGPSLENKLRRVADIEGRKAEVLATRRITRDYLAATVPSVSWIKVVRLEGDSYVSYEGNGRVAALQQVFAAERDVEVEVELYRFANPKKILRRINRVRRYHGLL